MKTKTTDTPRTDEEWDWANADGGERFKAVDADFARELERERDEYKAQLRRYGIPVPPLPNQR